MNGFTFIFMIIRATVGFLKTWTKAALKSSQNHGLFVAKEVERQRLKTCWACPSYRADFDMCQVCFCVMEIKAKLIEAECPEKRWPE